MKPATTPEENDWDAALRATTRASQRLPPLPARREIDTLDRATLFRELGYTFWNRELLDGLTARLCAEPLRRWVELAAGTGRLAAELCRRGMRIAATDDYSQAAGRVRDRQRVIAYGDWVACLSAREAMAEFRPDGAICAWPPLGSCLVPDLLAGSMAGSAELRLVICIGEPGGATEAPVYAEEIPEGWRREEWPECERFLIGFNDPPVGQSGSRLLVYRSLSAWRNLDRDDVGA